MKLTKKVSIILSMEKERYVGRHGYGKDLSPPPSSGAKELANRPIRLPIDKDSMGGSNTVWLVNFQDGTKAVFKPGKGERHLEIRESRGKLFKREVAAYHVSDKLGFNFVPKTELRVIDGLEGSIQEYVADPKQVLWQLSVRNQLLREQLFGVSIFDYIIWNKDRKTSPYDSESMYFKNNKLICIDNGLSFDEWYEYHISQNLSEYVTNQSIPQKLASNIRSFTSNTHARRELGQSLGNLIPSEAIENIFRRIDRVDSLFRQGRISNYDLNMFVYRP